jgi:hypothetical protein
MTKVTRDISVISASGSPATAMMSANLPFSIVPTSADHPMRSAATVVAADRLHRRHAPFDEVGELILLRAVRKRTGAAAERQHDAGRQRLLEALLHEHPAAVAEPLHLLLVLHAQVEHRDRQGQFLVKQHLQRGIVQIESVRRHVYARANAVVEAFAAVRMAGDLQSLAVGFVDDRLSFFEREGRSDKDRAVGTQNVLLSAVNLDPVDRNEPVPGPLL